MFSIPLLLSLLPVVTVHGAIGPSSSLTLGTTTAGPDGTSSHEVITVNGQFPSPMISATLGQPFKLNVKNNIKSTNPDFINETSIHWHGFFQDHTTWADGVAMVSQCPIPSGRSFLYNFTAPGQAGTYWYHSHIGLQYCDGLRGPLIVYDPNDPHKHLYNFDDESTVITLADWYDAGVAGSLPAGPPLDATLFNGKGRSATSNASVPYEIIEVEHGKSYRMRAISMACDPNFQFSIDGHNMTIIEADGQNTQPLLVDQFQIFAGQRYSFVLNASQPIGNYWIRALPNVVNRTDYTNGRNLAILRYKGANNTLPTTSQPISTNPLVETNLHPLEDPQAPGLPKAGGADITDVFYMGFNRATGKFSINGTEFDPNTLTTPVLLQMLNGVPPQSLLPAGSVYYLPRNKTVEITIKANQTSAFSPPGGPHPFHLHGHAFSVVQSAGNTTANYKNPVRRDVVSTGNVTNDDFATIRFDTNNPGPWIMHCHIDFHLNAGLALVFAEGTDQDVKSSNLIPAEVTQICAAPHATNIAIADKAFNGANTTNTTVSASPPASSLTSLPISSSIATASSSSSTSTNSTTL